VASKKTVTALAGYLWKLTSIKTLRSALVSAMPEITGRLGRPGQVW
jgi:hypothetical protein